MKKILLVLLLFATSMFADDTYTITVPNSASVEAYWTIFNFMAAIFHNNDYVAMLKLFALVGGAMTFIMVTVSSMQGESGGRNSVGSFFVHMISITAILTIVYSHKSNLIIKTDNLDSVYYTSPTTTTTTSMTGTVIGNVPTIYAYFASAFNTFGSNLTKLFNEGFSTENSHYDNINYASDMRNSMKVLGLEYENLDVTSANKISAFYEDCVLIPAANDPVGMTIMNEIYSSPNIKEQISFDMDNNTTINNVAMQNLLVTYHGGTYTCGDLWNQILSTDIPNLKDKLALELKGVGAGSAELITGTKDLPHSDFDEIAMQAGMLNMANKSAQKIASSSDLAYSAGKTRAQFVQDNVASGYYMSSMLPHMQTFMRMIIYGLFPFIFAISLLPGGWKILSSYAKAAIWIEMWAPTAAILNYFLMSYGESYIAGQPTYYEAQRMLSDTATLAGMAGYLYLSIPALTWGIMQGSFSMLGNLGGAVAARLTSNLGTAALAHDSGKLTEQQILSNKRGETVSMASIENLDSKHAAWDRASKIAANEDLGVDKVMRKNEFGIKTPSASLEAKLQQTGGNMSDVLGVESKFNAATFVKQRGELNTTGSMANFEKVGNAAGAENNAVVNTVDTHGTGAMTNSSTYDKNKTIVNNETEQKVLTENFGGVNKNLQNMKEMDTFGSFGGLNQKLIQVGGSTKAAGEVVATVAGQNFAGDRGRTENTTTQDTFNKGVVDATDINAQSANVQKFGKGVVQDNKTQQLNEQTIEASTRFKLVAETPMGTDDYFKTGATQKFKTEENPNFLRGDMNGDGKVSSKEIDKLASLNTTEAQLKTVEQAIGQKEDQQIGKELESAKVAQIQETKADVNGITTNTALQSKALARSAKVAIDKNVGSFNGRKDMKITQDLKGQGVQGETLAPKEVGKQLKDITATRSEANTLSSTLKEVVGQAGEIKKGVVENLKKQFPNKSETEINAMADKQMFNYLGQNGIFDKDLTKQAVQSETNAVKEKSKMHLQQALRKQFSAAEFGTLNNYNNLVNLKKSAEQNGNSTQAAALDKQIRRMESTHDMRQIQQKADKFMQTGTAKAIVNGANRQVQEVYNKYQASGAIQVSKNGKVSYLDTETALNNSSGDQKIYLTSKMKGTLDGLKTATNDIQGRQREWTQDITGNRVTDISRATQEYSNNGKFNYDVTYVASKGDYVSKENLAIGSTVLDIGLKTATIAPIGKGLKAATTTAKTLLKK